MTPLQLPTAMQSTESPVRSRLPRLFLMWMVEPRIVCQPLLGGLVYISILTGHPPLWVSWTIFLFPFLLRWWRYRMLIKRTPFDIPIAIFCVALIIGVAVSPNKAVSLETLQTYVFCILTYYIVVGESVRIRWYWKLVILVCMLFVLALALVTLAQQTGDRRFPENVIRMFSFNSWLYHAGSLLPFRIHCTLNPNALGTVTGLGVPAFLAFALLSKQLLQRIVAGILALFCIWLLIMTASVNGLFAAGVGIVFSILFWKPWVLFLHVPGGIAGIWLAISFIYPGHTPTWLSPVPTLVSRMGYWETTFLMMKGKVLTGMGLGTWCEYYTRAVAV